MYDEIFNINRFVEQFSLLDTYLLALLTKLDIFIQIGETPEIHICMQDQFNLTKATNLGYNLRTYFLSGFLEMSQQVISQQVHKTKESWSVIHKSQEGIAASPA